MYICMYIICLGQREEGVNRPPSRRQSRLEWPSTPPGASHAARLGETASAAAARTPPAAWVLRQQLNRVLLGYRTLIMR